MASLLAPPSGIEVPRGASKTFRITVKDQNGVVVDITGSTLIFTVKRNIGDRDPVIQKKTSNPTEGAVTIPTIGEAEFYLLAGDTVTLDPRAYAFDVWITLSTGKRYQIIAPSDFTVVRAVTEFV